MSEKAPSPVPGAGKPPVHPIEFTVPLDGGGALKFEAIDAPAERLAVYPLVDGELGEKIATVIPPQRIGWTTPALEHWARAELVPTFTEGSC